MKILTQDEIASLTRVALDIDLTIEKEFKEFGVEMVDDLQSYSPIYTALYFKSLNHDPKNDTWKNRDYVFSTNNYANLVQNLVKVHARYVDFSKLKNYLVENSFEQVENSVGDAIGHYLSDKEIHNKHQRYYYVVMSAVDILSQITSLEYILKNELSRIIILGITRSYEEDINKENKLNGRLINLGFDTLVINGNDSSQIVEAILYAKELTKPTVILVNLN